MLPVYLGMTQIAGPVWNFVLRKRVTSGKEDEARLGERHGNASVLRPDGPLLWVHALGIGEASAMLAVIRAIRAARGDISVLLTTNTKTGADGLARLGLPEGVIHQYAPLDTPASVTRFLDHWRPTVVAIAELDLWPLMVTRLSQRAVPVCLINARLTDHRFAGRKKWVGLYRPVLRLLDAILVQDPQSRRRMIELGARSETVNTVGLLKAAAEPLPAREEDLSALQSSFEERKVWLAASVEVREVSQILAAHAIARRAMPDLTLILAPRQPSEANRAAIECEALFGLTPRRSRGESPLAAAVFLADTIGEMGLWYRLAPVSFIGHSLAVEEGRPLTGKNPFEAVALGSVVLHGPNVGNFAESYEALDTAGACGLVQTDEEIAEKVMAYIKDPLGRLSKAEVARSVLDQGRRALDMTVETLLGRFPPAKP